METHSTQDIRRNRPPHIRYTPETFELDHLRIPTDESLINTELYPILPLEATSLVSEPNLESPPSLLGRAQTTYTIVTSHPDNILKWPQRIFRWLYSISLVLFVILLLAFVSVTPLDVIAQTLDATSYSAMKTFIVIIVCVVFLVLSFLFYFLRIYQFKVLLNDIPAKSLYVPFEADLPQSVFAYIDETLRKCVSEISVKAGPLEDKNLIINHPGVAPPEYIQKRNKGPNGEGTLLPPNCHYEDVIRSLGDRFYVGKILTEDEIPNHLSLREIMLYLYELYVEDSTPSTRAPDLIKLTKLYEKCRFGPDLIQEKDLFDFMVEFDKFALMCQNDYQNNLPKQMSRRLSRASRLMSMFDSASNVDYYTNDDTRYYSNTNIETEDEEKEDPGFQHKAVLNEYFLDLYGDQTSSSDQSVLNPYQENRTSQDQDSIKRTASFNSSQSIVRSKLALNAGNNSIPKLRYNDEALSLKRDASGYVSDTESEINFEEENEEGTTAEDFYRFRRRRQSSGAFDPIDVESSPLQQPKMRKRRPD